MKKLYFISNGNKLLSIFLLLAISLSIIGIVYATAPNPGHDVTAVSGGAVQGDLFYGSAADTLSALAKNTSATRYLSNTGSSNNPAWAQVVLTDGVSGILPTANGGTGMAFFTVSGPASTAKTFTFPNANSTVLTDNTDVTVAQGGTGVSTLTGLLQGNGTGAITGISNSSTVGQVLRVTGASTYAWGSVDLADTDAVTGTLTVANGGTGVATLGDAGVLIGNGTGAVAVTGAGTSGQVLTSNGAGVDPTFQSAAGGNDARVILDALTTGEQFDATANSTTMTEATNLSQTLAAGTYTFRYYVIWRSNDATNGIKLNVNYSGTNGAFVWQWSTVSTVATASNAVPDQDAILATASVENVFASRAEATTGARGTLLSADTVNADMMAIVEGVFVATGSGDLELWAGNEAAGAGDFVSLMIGTSVEIFKTK